MQKQPRHNLSAEQTSTFQKASPQPVQTQSRLRLQQMHAQRLHWQPWWRVCVWVCVCALQRLEIAASAGRGDNKLAVLLKEEGGGGRKESQTVEWESFVGRQRNFSVGCEEMRTETSDYKPWYKRPHTWTHEVTVLPGGLYTAPSQPDHNHSSHVWLTTDGTWFQSEYFVFH